MVMYFFCCWLSIATVEDPSADASSAREEEDAAVKIQAFYRGYQTRRDLADKRDIQLYGPAGKPGKKKKTVKQQQPVVPSTTATQPPPVQQPNTVTTS